MARDFLTVIVNRPNHDDATKYAYYWFEKVIAYMKARGFTITDAKGVSATRANWLANLKNQIFQTGVGHGNAEVWAGMYNEVLLRANRDEPLMEGRVVYPLACSVGQILGPQLVSIGKAWAFLGWNVDFTFMASKRPGTGDPDDDPYQKAFMDPVIYVCYAFADGKRPSEAWEIGLKIWKQKIAEAPEGSAQKKWLIHDCDGWMKTIDKDDPITGVAPAIEKVEFYYRRPELITWTLIGQGVQEGNLWKTTWDTKTVLDGDYVLAVKAYPRSSEWQPSDYVERNVKVDNSTLPKAKAEWVSPEEGAVLRGKVELKAKASAE